MARTYSQEEIVAGSRVNAPAPPTGRWVGAAAILFVAGLALLALYQQNPPSVVAADAPAEVFSSGRALDQLKKISQSPRPVGSAGHAQARERILQELAAQGLETEVQTTTAVSARRSNALRAATVHNIVARLRGSANQKAVLVAGHYDTVPNSPGAADDGSSVATMLETIRSLKSGAALKNDVLFLFTDAEEIGLLGAKAFADEHPSAKAVGVTLNLEARGSGGPAMMFETSRGNRWLIEALAEAAPHPRASSLAYEIYRLLPNDTDLSVFKEAGLPGMNFAFVDGFMRYHTRADNLENFDERSLQHQGSYALPLVRHFGGLNFPAEAGGDAVYSDVLGLTLIRYPAAWVLPLTALVALLFAGVTALGLRRGLLTFAGIWRGCLAFALSVVCASAVVWAVWWLLSGAQVRFGRGLGDDFYQSKLYLAAFCAVCVAVVTTIYRWFQKGAGGRGLAWGAQFCCLLGLAAVSVFVPGGSYLLAWPLLFCVLALAYDFATRGSRRHPFALPAVVAVCVSPAVVLFVPIIYQSFIAVGLAMAWAVAALAAILLALLVSHFTLLTDLRGKLLPAVAAAAAALLLATAALGFQFDGRHPKSDNVFYMLNADTGRAVWASADGAPDEWTAQFLTDSPETGSIIEYTPLYSGNFLKSQAQAAALGPPRVELLEEGGADGARTLRLRVVPSRPGASVSALVAGATPVSAAEVNGKRVVNALAGGDGQARPPWSLQYWGAPAEGVELRLEVKTSGPVKMVVVERTDGLPQVPDRSFRPRPDHLMPSPSPSSDAAFVGKTFTF